MGRCDDRGVADGAMAWVLPALVGLGGGIWAMRYQDPSSGWRQRVRIALVGTAVGLAFAALTALTT